MGLLGSYRGGPSSILVHCPFRLGYFDSSNARTASVDANIVAANAIHRMKFRSSTTALHFFVAGQQGETLSSRVTTTRRGTGYFDAVPKYRRSGGGWSFRVGIRVPSPPL